MTRPAMRVVLLTEGDPERISGGSLYQRRVADRAVDHDATLTMQSVPARRFPMALVDGPRVLRRARRDGDVVAVDSLASNTLGPWIAVGGLRGRPMVGSVHQRMGGTDLSRVRTFVQGWFDRWAYRRCRHVVVPSALLAAQLVEQGLAADHLVIVPPGRDTPEAIDDDVDGRPPVDLRAGRRLAVLCVGNWVARKGILELIDAVGRLPADTVTLHLVGDEHLDDEYRQRVLDRLGRADVADRVLRHGTVPPGRMPAWFAAADVFVLASTEEPYGMVYAEAMAAGTPVVGWNAGNLPHLIDDGVEGLLVPTGDVDALADALAGLADETDRRAAMGAAARHRADELPTWADTARRFYDVCRAALADRG